MKQKIYVAMADESGNLKLFSAMATKTKLMYILSEEEAKKLPTRRSRFLKHQISLTPEGAAIQFLKKAQSSLAEIKLEYEYRMKLVEDARLLVQEAINAL